MTNWKIFEGTGQPRKNPADRQRIAQQLAELPCPPWREFGQGAAARRGQTFQATPEMVEAVNAALYLRRPLLVEGKPGTGKTSLAYAVAQELGLGEVLQWSITTRTMLQDALYRYDAIGRLQEVQRLKDMPMTDTSPPLKPVSPDAGSDLTIGDYLQLGPLGTALLPISQDSNQPGTPRILLIDEIDKSDIDLPNDLLNVFEEGSFAIRELERIKVKAPTVRVRTAYGAGHPEATVEITQGQVQCNHFPVVILTSNGERDFPAPFLRRCLRLRMPEPTPERLAQIVQAHLGLAVDPETGTLTNPEAQGLIDRFVAQRDRGSLATDQLLNVACLLLGQNPPTDSSERERLLDLLWRDLDNT